MRVLVVVNQVAHDQSALWEFANESGSVEVHLTGSAPRSGLEVYKPNLVGPLGLESSLMAPRVLRRNSDHLWWYYPALAQKIREFVPDLIHIHSEMWGLTVLQALKLHPVIVAHGADNQFFFGKGLERAVRSKILQYAISRISGYVSWNLDGAELAERLRPSLPTAVVPGVPVRRARHSMSVATRPSNTLRVAFIGRLTRSKGILTFLEAAKSIKESTANDIPEFVVIGDGPERPAVLALSIKGVVNYHGALSHDKALEVLSSCDIVVVPSVDTPTWKEQYCRSAVEALSRGVPVLYSDAGALPEVVGLGGVQFTQGDPNDLREKLVGLLSESSARALYSEAGKRVYYERHDPQVLAAKLVEFWGQVRSRNGTSR